MNHGNFVEFSGQFTLDFLPIATPRASTFRLFCTPRNLQKWTVCNRVGKYDQNKIVIFTNFLVKILRLNQLKKNLKKIKTLQFHEKNPTFWSFIFWSKWRWFSGFQERQSAKNKSMIYDYIFGNSSFSIFFSLFQISTTKQHSCSVSLFK